MSGAVFSDVEGTLLGGSTPRLFIKKGNEVGLFSRYQVIEAIVLSTLGKPLPLQYNTYLRFLIFRRLVKKHTVAEIDALVQIILPQMTANLKPQTLGRLKKHQADEGLPVVLVSGGLQAVTGALADSLGVEGEGTIIEVKNGVYTGRTHEPVCQGEHKAERVKQVARRKNIDLQASIGYGDTFSDIAFLSLMGKAVVVDPEPALQSHAERHGWEILLTNS